MAEPPDDWRQHSDWRERWQEQIKAEHERGEWKARWLQEPVWTAAELATLCCGWSPDSQGLPPRGPFILAIERIVRAVHVNDLQPVHPGVYHRHQFFDGHYYFFDAGDDDKVTPPSLAVDPPAIFERLDATRWAAVRFEAFPFQPDTGVSQNAPLAFSAGLRRGGSVLPFPMSAIVAAAPDPVALGKVLRGLFERCGSGTIEEFAQRLGYNESSIKRHFKGEFLPRRQALVAYVDLFNRELRPDSPLTVQALFDAAREVQEQDAAPHPGAE